MKEYIDREAAKNAIFKYILNQEVSTYPTSEICKAAKSGAEGAMYEIDYVPAADVVEVVHGEWKETEYPGGDMIYTCSACGEDWVTIDGTPAENNMKFCPNCGAKMDGGNG